MSTIQKKVLKKKVATMNVVETPALVEPVADEVPVPAAALAVNPASDNIKFVIPSSRIHNYVSGVKLNKEVDEKIHLVKTEGFSSVKSLLSESDLSDINNKVLSAEESNNQISAMLTRINAGEDLSSVLSVDDQKKIGDIVKTMEANNSKSDDKEEQKIDLISITVDYLSKKLVNEERACTDVLSKQRAKFSKDSFNVLSAFGDMVVEEITSFALERLSEVGNSTIEPKYLFSSKASEGSLYGFYSNLPSFVKVKNAVIEEEANKELAKQLKKEHAKQLKKAAKNGDVVEAETSNEDVVENTTDEEVVETEDVSDKKINFKFYVKSIVYNLKKSDEKYSNAKVSDRYQSFCSDIVLDILDNVVDLSQIILNVMSTKTISSNLFKTCIYTQVYKLDNFEKIKSELEGRIA